jgi:hypothetical protein
MTDEELGALVRRRVRELTEKKNEIWKTVPGISGGLNPMSDLRSQKVEELALGFVAEIAVAAGVEET